MPLYDLRDAAVNEQRGTGCGFADPEPRQPVDTGSDQPLEELMSEQIRDDASEAESVMAAALRLIMAIPAENRTAHWLDLVTVACPRCDRQVLYAAVIASIEAETAVEVTAAWTVRASRQDAGAAFDRMFGLRVG